jgi:hypothetical protein
LYVWKNKVCLFNLLKSTGPEKIWALNNFIWNQTFFFFKIGMNRKCSVESCNLAHVRFLNCISEICLPFVLVHLQPSLRFGHWHGVSRMLPEWKNLWAHVSCAGTTAPPPLQKTLLVLFK